MTPTTYTCRIRNIPKPAGDFPPSQHKQVAKGICKRPACRACIKRENREKPSMALLNAKVAGMPRGSF